MVIWKDQDTSFINMFFFHIVWEWKGIQCWYWHVVYTMFIALSLSGLKNEKKIKFHFVKSTHALRTPNLVHRSYTRSWLVHLFVDTVPRSGFFFINFNVYFFSCFSLEMIFFINFIVFFLFGTSVLWHGPLRWFIFIFL